MKYNNKFSVGKTQYYTNGIRIRIRIRIRVRAVNKVIRITSNAKALRKVLYVLLFTANFLGTNAKSKRIYLQ